MQKKIGSKDSDGQLKYIKIDKREYTEICAPVQVYFFLSKACEV
jgi:hypothetical protein